MRKSYKILIGCLVFFIVPVGIVQYMLMKFYEIPSEFPDPGDKTPVITVAGKIIFFSYRPDYGLYVVENGNVRRLTDAGVSIFSKDGSKIMHKYKDDTLAIKDYNSLDIEKIIKFPEPYHAIDYDWSPDGKYICFTDDPIDDNKSFNNLYTYNIETNEVKQLTFFTGNTSWSIVNPKYSPDGSKIVFECPKNIEKGDCGAPISLFVINSDGTGLHELFGDKHWGGGAASWSPNGKEIVFVSHPSGHPYDDLYLYNFDTKEIKQLTDDYWQDEHPVFSPDGNQICYVSPRHGDYGFGKELFVINADGTGMARVTPPYKRKNAKGIFAKWAGDDYPQWSR